MATPKQIEANRKNAKRSTGPKTAKGKARASKNAIRHGLLSDNPVVHDLEDLQDWRTFEVGIRDSLAPLGMLEEALTYRVALCFWRLRRTDTYERGATEKAVEKEKNGYQPAICQLKAQLAEKEKELQDWRPYVKDDKQLNCLLEQIELLPAETPVAGGDAVALFVAFNGVFNFVPGHTDEFFDFHDHDFLTGLGVPAEYQSEARLTRWPGWTAGFIRKALVEAAKDFGITPEDTLAKAIQDSRDELQQLATLETTVKDLRRQVSCQDVNSLVRLIRNGILLDDETLAKIFRYESHISRQMYQALHELQRLQAARRAGNIPPPAAADITVNAPEAA